MKIDTLLVLLQKRPCGELKGNGKAELIYHALLNKGLCCLGVMASVYCRVTSIPSQILNSQNNTRACVALQSA